MAGDTDLERMLASLDVERRPGTFTFVVSDDVELADVALATIDESEGRTLVVSVAHAVQLGLDVEFEAAWLTLTVFSALDAVGLTAAVSGVLADAGIPCNMLAGYHHDHLLVPVDCADEAAVLLWGLSSR